MKAKPRLERLEPRTLCDATAEWNRQSMVTMYVGIFYMTPAAIARPTIVPRRAKPIAATVPKPTQPPPAPKLKAKIRQFCRAALTPKETLCQESFTGSESPTTCSSDAQASGATPSSSGGTEPAAK